MDHKPMNVLLVEDDAGDARLLREMFHEQVSYNAKVTHAESMSEAEKQVAEHTFDIIVLDLGLPDAQGLAALRRAHLAGPHIPLVVLTGLDDEALAVQALKEGAQDYLVKGQIETHGLMRALRYAIERKIMEVNINSDVIGLKRAEAELRESELKLRLALESAGMGTWSADPVTWEVTFDARAKAMFGVSADTPFTYDIFHTVEGPGDRAQLRPEREALRRGDFNDEFRVIGIEDRQERFLALRGRSYFEGETCTCIVGIVLDMTERQARQREGDLRVKHDAAVAANQAKSRFLAAASHDLRQPLHAIGLFLHVLKAGPPPAQTKVVLDNISIAVASMQRMFNGLLDVVRLDAGMMAPRPQTFRLQTTFGALHANFAVNAETKGLSLHVHPTPFTVTTDPILLQSILQNLMSNAISYTSCGEVVVEAREIAGRVVIEVRDTGRGMPQDRLEDIFQEFVRLDRGGASENGMGLGLAIVRRQATELGATIDVQSAVGVGSTFTLSLPEVARMAEQPNAPDEPAKPSLSGARILLVEDHKLVLAALVMQVESWGARPLPAASADEAMTLLAIMTPESPDAAIVDLDLGDKVSGIELLKQIEQKFGTAIPAIIVTGSTTAETLERIHVSGYPWLTKPTDPDALHEALARRMGARRRSAESSCPALVVTTCGDAQ
jgi:two-component system, sensor histidine kinase